MDLYVHCTYLFSICLTNILARNKWWRLCCISCSGYIITSKVLQMDIVHHTMASINCFRVQKRTHAELKKKIGSRKLKPKSFCYTIRCPLPWAIESCFFRGNMCRSLKTGFHPSFEKKLYKSTILNSSKPHKGTSTRAQNDSQ